MRTMTKAIAIIENIGIEQLKVEADRFEGITIEDLAVKETVDELAVRVKAVKDAAKAVKEANDKFASFFKAAVKDEDANVTAYSWDNGYKLCSVKKTRKGGIDVDKLAEILVDRLGAVEAANVLAECAKPDTVGFDFAPKAIAGHERKKHDAGQLDDVLVIG